MSIEGRLGIQVDRSHAWCIKADQAPARTDRPKPFEAHRKQAIGSRLGPVVVPFILLDSPAAAIMLIDLNEVQDTADWKQ